MRGAGLSTLVITVAHLGGTVGIVLLRVVAFLLTFAVTRRWAPGVFLIVAVVGETAIYLATTALASRARP